MFPEKIDYVYVMCNVYVYVYVYTLSYIVKDIKITEIYL